MFKRVPYIVRAVLSPDWITLCAIFSSAYAIAKYYLILLFYSRIPQNSVQSFHATRCDMFVDFPLSRVHKPYALNKLFYQKDLDNLFSLFFTLIKEYLMHQLTVRSSFVKAIKSSAVAVKNQEPDTSAELLEKANDFSM